jgi:cytochrome c-type biogenesis protein CcmH/NrfG
VVALRSGDRDEAVAVWKTAVGLDPTNLEALYNLGTTLARNGEAAAARPYLEQFLKTAPLQAERDRHEVARLLKDIS